MAKKNVHPKPRQSKSASFVAEPLYVDIDARRLAQKIADTIAKAHRERIPRGEKADGSGGNKTARGGRDRILGHETGRLAASFTGRVSGGDSEAKGDVAARNLDRGRQQYLERNAHLLVFEGEDGTPLSDEIDAVIEAELDKMFS